MRSTPTSEHARFLELDSTNYNAPSWLPNWSAGGLTWSLYVSSTLNYGISEKSYYLYRPSWV